MDEYKQNVIKLAKHFVRVPSFALAYGAFAKLYENDETLDNFKLEILSKLMDFCSFMYNSNRDSFYLLNGSVQTNEQCSLVDILSCTFCKRVINQPVTLSCGHTYCRKCVDPNFTCHTCPHSTKFDHINECIILANLIYQLFPQYASVNQRLIEARKLLDHGQCDESFAIYDQLLAENPECYYCMLAKAEACLITNSPEEVVRIVDHGFKHQPLWPKLYCLKGIALKHLKRYPEAAEYLFCSLTMYPHCERIKNELCQVFTDMFLTNDIEALKNIVDRCSVRPNSIDMILKTLPEDLKTLVPVTFWMDYSPNSLEPSAMTVDEIAVSKSALAKFECVTTAVVEQLRDDFFCALCLRILLLPLTPPCGHSFCRQCLDKCLDYKAECPLCKTDLTNYVSVSKQGVNLCLTKLLKQFFSQELKERQLAHEAECAILFKLGLDTQYELPVLSCGVAIPGVLCPLFIYEPRYRTMIRRALAGSRRFGLFASGNSFCGLTEIGTIVQLKNVETLPDGGCLVDTIGCRRIRVLGARYIEGCICINYEFFSDLPIERQDEQAYVNLCSDVYSMASDWQTKLPNETRISIIRYFGVLPNMHSELPEGSENGPPLWVWWLVSVLPLGERCKYVLLSFKNPEVRMHKLKSLLARIRDREPILTPADSLQC